MENDYDIIEEETQEQSEKQSNSRPWLFQKGKSGNPGGRPVGAKSMKTYIRERFLRMTDEEKEEFLDGINKIELFKMAEGNPESVQKTDITTQGEKLPSTDLDKLAELMSQQLKDEKI